MTLSVIPIRLNSKRLKKKLLLIFLETAKRLYIYMISGYKN